MVDVYSAAVGAWEVAEDFWAHGMGSATEAVEARDMMERMARDGFARNCRSPYEELDAEVLVELVNTHHDLQRLAVQIDRAELFLDVLDDDEHLVLDLHRFIGECYEAAHEMLQQLATLRQHRAA